MIRSCWLLAIFVPLIVPAAAEESDLRLSWENNILTVVGETIPGGSVQIWYMEAYCRAGSTDRDWNETTIGHRTELVAVAEDGRSLRLQCTLDDGVLVRHHIRVVPDGVDFRVTAHNPTEKSSHAHWAQPCVRVDRFTKADQATYLPKSFVFLNGQLARMPTPRWSTQARYTPGQVWRAPGVSRDDVNPRPLNEEIPSNGLIGCFSADEQWVLASAWEPWQELFQGVIVCLHSDFRIGGLHPGETKSIHGRLYLMPAAEGDITNLLSAYRRDFPEQQ